MEDYMTPDFVQKNDVPRKAVAAAAAPSSFGNFFQENKMMIIIFGVVVVIVVLLLIWVMTREKKPEPNKRPPPGNQNPAGGGPPNNPAQQPVPQPVVPQVPQQGVPNLQQPVPQPPLVAQQAVEANAPAIKQLIKTNIETVDDNELNKFMNLGEEELESSDDKDNVDEGDFDNLDVESSD